MTLEQVKSFIIGVLKGWFTNKAILDKLDVNEDGDLTYDGTVVDGTETYTDDEVAQAVTDTLAELNTTSTEGE